MTSRDIPHDSPCPVCRAAGEALAGLEARVRDQAELIEALGDRCRGLVELLSKRAERMPPAVDDGDYEE